MLSLTLIFEVFSFSVKSYAYLSLKVISDLYVKVSNSSSYLLSLCIVHIYMADMWLSYTRIQFFNFKAM